MDKYYKTLGLRPDRTEREVRRQYKKLENKKIPDDIDYDDVYSLRKEAVQKLKELRPTGLIKSCFPPFAAECTATRCAHLTAWKALR